MKRFLLLTAILLTGILACRKDDLPSEGDLTLQGYNWGKEMLVSAYGLILDETDSPVADAQVSLGNLSTTTDQNGVFRIRNAQVREKLAQVKVEKSGFFVGSRSFRPSDNRNPYIRIKLLKKEIAGTFQSGPGGEVVLGSKVSIQFPADGVSTLNGQAYSGEVQVAISYIDPTASDLDQRMPGNLLGFREGTGEMGLATFGMVAVELSGSQGQPLQLASGKKATLALAVPNSLASTAPANIPLWHYDESIGIWVEEGEAVLENGRYIGEVSHFSFWNCDVPYPLVHMEGSVFLDSLGNPFSGALIRITVLSSSFSGFGFSDEDGLFEGSIPSGEDLLLEIVDLCGVVVYQENIGPFGVDVILDPIIISSGSLTYTPVQVTGTLVDCDGLAVTDGYIKVQAGQNVAIFQTDPATGVFDGVFQACDSSDFILIGVDETALLQSDTATFTPAPLVDAGIVSACTVELAEYVKFKMDGVDHLFTEYVSLADSIPGAGFILYAQGITQNDRIAIVTPATGLGDFQALEFGFGFGNYAQDPENIIIMVTEYGPAPGDVVKGTFSGNYLDSFGNPHEVSGEFKALRDF
ncbi:MAG: carboxypeptidase regulatory-like domain-containing protein [Saprospirales bacterium]|nr:carboxypeptidase regulatory-like domain-containing protein [Saprospirales bacterium]